MENRLPKDGEVFYFPDFFTAQESAAFIYALKSEIIWKQEPITLFGKKFMQPRLTAWVGDADKPIRYSGITMTSQPWTKTLLEIKNRIEPVAKVTFTNALLNQYRDGQDSVGWHRDNEKELGTNPVIGSVSLGEAREFQFRHSVEKDLKESIVLGNGSFLLMQGSTQHNWHHSIPKTKTPVGPRINITFRVMKN